VHVLIFQFLFIHYFYHHFLQHTNAGSSFNHDTIFHNLISFLALLQLSIYNLSTTPFLWNIPYKCVICQLYVLKMLLRAAFSRPRSQSFTKWTHPKPANLITYLFLFSPPQINFLILSLPPAQTCHALQMQ